MVKKAFAAKVAGAPVTVVPAPPTVKVVTACVQLTCTRWPAVRDVGSVIVPVAKPAVGVRISQVSPALTVTVKAVAEGAAYCVAKGAWLVAEAEAMKARMIASGTRRVSWLSPDQMAKLSPGETAATAESAPMLLILALSLNCHPALFQSMVLRRASGGNGSPTLHSPLA